MRNGSRRVFVMLSSVFAALAIWFSGAAADMFPWAEAETETGELRLADGTEVAYRSGAILLGDRFEVAVALEWTAVDAPVEQEIVREMTDSPPVVSARGDVVEISWKLFPIGADAEITVTSCWRLAVDRLAFKESPCGCSH